MTTLPQLESFLKTWWGDEFPESSDSDSAFPAPLSDFVRIASTFSSEIPEYRQRFEVPPKSWIEFNDDPWEVSPPQVEHGWVIADFDHEIPIPVWCTDQLELTVLRPGGDQWTAMGCDFDEFAIGFLLNQLHRNWKIRLSDSYKPASDVEPFFEVSSDFSRWIGGAFYFSEGLLWRADGSYVCANTIEVASQYDQNWFHPEQRVT